MSNVETPITGKITTASEWKKASGAGPLDLPSGKTCLVIRPGIMAFAKEGLIPNSLMGIMNKAAQGKLPDKDLQKGLGEILEDTQKMKDMLSMVDAITVYCVIQPKVTPTSEREVIMADESLTAEERVAKIDSMLFVDEVDETDKMFIFNWAVGGDRDLDRFREQQGAMLERLPAGQDVEHPTKRTTRPKKR